MSATSGADPSALSTEQWSLKGNLKLDHNHWSGDATKPRPTGFPCLFAEPRDGLGEARRPETKRLRQPPYLYLGRIIEVQWPDQPMADSPV